MTICSLIVQAKPDTLQPVSKTLSDMDGVEIHATDKNGKIIVSIDHPDREYCSQAMHEINYIQGVMSTALVYEYQEDLENQSNNNSEPTPMEAIQ